MRELRELMGGCEVCLGEIGEGLSSVGVFAVALSGELGIKTKSANAFWGYDGMNIIGHCQSMVSCGGEARGHLRR